MRIFQKARFCAGNKFRTMEMGWFYKGVQEWDFDGVRDKRENGYRKWCINCEKTKSANVGETEENINIILSI